MRDDRQWRALVDLMGRPAWCDEDLATVAGRRERADDIDRRLQDWFAGQPLGLDGGAAGRRGRSRRARGVAVVGDREPPTARPGFLRDAAPPEHRAGLYPCPPFASLAGQDRWLLRPPPRLGEHNGEVLRDRCGLTDEELANLATSGVIGTRPKGL